MYNLTVTGVINNTTAPKYTKSTDMRFHRLHFRVIIINSVTIGLP